jgi:hypothetical protein
MIKRNKKGQFVTTRTHGMSKTPEYKAWEHMRERCYKTNNPRYHSYGGRGIKVCESWRESFVSFFNDMGFRPGPDFSLERIDNNGDYEPNNCCWATKKEQSQNTRPYLERYPIFKEIFMNNSISGRKLAEKTGISKTVAFKIKKEFFEKELTLLESQLEIFDT